MEQLTGLDFKISEMAARIKELRDMGYIVCSGMKIDEITKKRNKSKKMTEIP